MSRAVGLFQITFSLIFLLLLSGGCKSDSASPENLDPEVTMEEHVALSGSYLNHRFFHLDLPPSQNYPVSDVPGRDPLSLRIDPASLHLFRMTGPGTWGPNDIRNVAAYVDSTGVFWNTPECPEPDFSNPGFYAEHWQRVEFDLLLSVDSELIAVDLRQELTSENIDINKFELKIERDTPEQYPDIDEHLIPYIQIFGLDQNNQEHAMIPDGFVDSSDGSIFNLRKGLLFFPLDFPTPFNAGQMAYEAYANDSDFEWEDSFLMNNQRPELYDVNIMSSQYFNYPAFRIVSRYATSQN